jgi:hypothetical protein
MRTLLVAALALGAIPAAALSGAASAQSMDHEPPLAGPCDAACLDGYVDQYLDAMLANDVDPDLFARDVKFTENGIRLPLGDEGLWYGMSGKGDYQFYVPDVETEQVAFIGTVYENQRSHGENDGSGNLVAIALRLKIVNDKITEVEQLAIRPDVPLRPDPDAPPAPPGTGDRVNAMGAPNPIFSEVIPEAERPSREELIHVANFYFSGLAHNDGKGYYPFTDDCDRFENGIQTTQTNCKYQFENTLKGVVYRVRDRRFVAVDREHGIVFAFAFFDHPQINWTWQLAELFKIEDGEIRRIEAVFDRAPYGIPSGWSTWEQSMSENIQSVR